MTEKTNGSRGKWNKTGKMCCDTQHLSMIHEILINNSHTVISHTQTNQELFMIKKIYYSIDVNIYPKPSWSSQDCKKAHTWSKTNQVYKRQCCKGKGRAPLLCELRLYITDGRQWFWCMIGGQCWRLAGGGLELVHCPRGQDTMEQWPASAASAAWQPRRQRPGFVRGQWDGQSGGCCHPGLRCPPPTLGETCWSYYTKKDDM